MCYWNKEVFGKNGKHMMGKFLMALVLVAAFATPASAYVYRGVITSVNPAIMTFLCHWRTNNWIYKTTGKTVFRLGKSPASFANLKVGDTVKVKFHIVDKDWIADRVNIITAEIDQPDRPTPSEY